ncbi:NAD+ diphosphatase [Tamaricihabitans halophyticus]|uniref:NAD(+) diphosphatase n=1 Tax=Tamaricihabitans halophyticus TaxID=1262583 RepID=A0A4R2R0E5_9PSEU|nr:NAD(+) diphosphatase [Tamaricihabitans halophyticus]TCP56080.1 NAD+ diphosphatase [Tamaricihabitans halophyticus]
MSSVPFQLGAVPTLSRSTVVRDEQLRQDAERLTAQWNDSWVVVVDKLGRTPVRDGGGSLALRPAAEFGSAPPADVVLLGEQDGVAYWATHGSDDAPVDLAEFGRRGWDPPAPGDGETWADLRGVGAVLDDTSAGLLTTAVALLHWHRRGQHCARCGGEVRRVFAGWATQCPNCGNEEYPRTDPAVICLVHDDAGVNGEQVLLARQPSWPAGRYSVLAGFVEAGESLEACVVREIREEVGVHVDNVRYLGSQPWPFPRSLMLGFAARASRAEELVLADGEIAEARWVSRADVQEAIEAGGRTDKIGLPGGSSIARLMVEAWAAAD